MIAEIINSIIIILLFYGITCLLGYPFFFLLRTSHTRQYGFVICPVLGFSMGMIIMYYLNYFEWSVEKMVMPILSLTVIIDLILLVNTITKKEFVNYVKHRNKDSFIRFGGCILVFALSAVLFSIPGVANNKGNLAILHSNNDFALYSATTNAIKLFGKTDVIKNAGLGATWVFGSQNRYCDYWAAFISGLFKISVFNALFLLIIYMYASVVLAEYVFTKELVHYEKRSVSVLASIFCLFNCNLLFLCYNGFIAQIISLTYMILITLFIVFFVREDKPQIKDAISTGILLAGMAATYGEMVPIILVPTVLLLIIEFVYDSIHAKVLLIDYGIVASAFAVVFGHGYKTVLDMIVYSNDNVVGWDILPGYLLQALGIYNTHLIGRINDYEWPDYMVIIISVVIFVGLVFYIVNTFTLRERNLILLFLLSFSFLYLFFLFHYDSYKGFKALMNMSYLFITVFCLMICNLKKHNKGIAYLILFFITVLICRNGLSFWLVNYSISESIEDDKHTVTNIIDEDYDELADFFENNDYDVVYSSCGELWDSLIASALVVKEDSECWDLNEYYFPSNGNDYGNAIIIDSSTVPDPIRIYGDILLKNEVYTVKKINLKYPFCSNPINSGKMELLAIDEDGRWVSARTIENNVVQLDYYANHSDSYDMELILRAETEEKITLTLPNGKVEELVLDNGDNVFKIEDVSFSKGNNILIIDRLDNENYNKLYLKKLSFVGAPEYKSVQFSEIDWQDTYGKWLSFRYLSEMLSKRIKMKSFDGQPLRLEFCEGGNYKDNCEATGLHAEEKNGIWTQQDFSFSFNSKIETDAIIRLNGSLLTNYSLHVYCNDKELEPVSINEESLTINSIYVPIIKKGKNTIRVYIENIRSPYDLSGSEDHRKLGIFLSSIVISKADFCETTSGYSDFKDIKCSVGETIVFDGENASNERYLSKGFSSIEESAVWTDGNTAEMEFELIGELEDIVIGLDYSAFNKQRVSIWANDYGVSDYIAEGHETKLFYIPSNCLEGNRLKIRYELPDAISPKELGVSEDQRCLGLYIESIRIDSYTPKKYELGTEIQFNTTNNSGGEYLLDGFSISEENGTWTDDKMAILAFELEERAEKDLSIEMEYSVYDGPQSVELFCNGELVETFKAMGQEQKKIMIKPENIGQSLLLSFKLPDAHSPASKHESEDDRNLALYIEKMIIK